MNAMDKSIKSSPDNSLTKSRDENSTPTTIRSSSWTSRVSSPVNQTINKPKKRWMKAFNVIRAAKQFQKVRFIVDPKLHPDIDEYPIAFEEDTIDESSIYYLSNLSNQQAILCTRERYFWQFINSQLWSGEVYVTEGKLQNALLEHLNELVTQKNAVVFRQVTYTGLNNEMRRFFDHGWENSFVKRTKNNKKKVQINYYKITKDYYCIGTPLASQKSHFKYGLKSGFQIWKEKSSRLNSAATSVYSNEPPEGSEYFNTHSDTINTYSEFTKNSLDSFHSHGASKNIEQLYILQTRSSAKVDTDIKHENSNSERTLQTDSLATVDIDVEHEMCDSKRTLQTRSPVKVNFDVKHEISDLEITGVENASVKTSSSSDFQSYVEPNEISIGKFAPTVNILQENDDQSQMEATESEKSRPIRDSADIEIHSNNTSPYTEDRSSVGHNSVPKLPQTETEPHTHVHNNDTNEKEIPQNLALLLQEWSIKRDEKDGKQYFLSRMNDEFGEETLQGIRHFKVYRESITDNLTWKTISEIVVEKI